MSAEAYTFRFVVDDGHHGLRIDTFLASRVRNHAPAQLQRLAREGLVTVDAGPCPPDRRVFRGEEVVVRLAEPPGPFYPAEPIPLDVLYDDPWFIAVNKPAGLIAHPVGPVDGGTLANAVQFLLDGQTRRPGLLRPGIVHRLDRETSGVVLIAKDHIAHSGLTRQFERSEVAKTYLALVAGRIGPDTGVIDAPIGQRQSGLLMSAGADAAATRPAVTEFRVVERFPSATLVRARPHTGRKHQIRVHLAAAGHPVLGDAYYGPGTSGPRRGDPRPRGRHALHAAAIAFHHPVTNAPMRVVAPAPPDFWSTLSQAVHGAQITS